MPLAAVGWQFWWSSNRFSCAEKLEEFRKEVGNPVRDLLVLVDDLDSKIDDCIAGRRGETHETIMSAGKKLTRRTNRFIGDASNSGFGDDQFWDKINTEWFDEVISQLNQHSTTIHYETVRRNLERLQDSLEGCRALRPKSGRN